ncbi:hypothetical protein PMAYCL1PPCAC_20312, partial [Pristionchus mayeri]
ESILNMRRTSRCLRAHVDSFALREETIMIVENLELMGEFVIITTRGIYSHLFELRMRLRLPSLEYVKYIGHKTLNKFSVDRNNKLLVECVRDAMGKRLNEVVLEESLNGDHDPQLINTFASLTRQEGIQFECLKVQYRVLTEKSVNFLMRRITELPI